MRPTRSWRMNEQSAERKRHSLETRGEGWDERDDAHAFQPGHLPGGIPFLHHNKHFRNNQSASNNNTNNRMKLATCLPLLAVSF